MAIKLNTKGAAHARDLIRSGKVDKSSSWSFSADDGNKILGDDNWSEYGKWFLAVDNSADKKIKEHYKYPFGKNGKVYRSALTTIRQRAGQQSANDIFESAGSLLELIDKKEAARYGPTVLVPCAFYPEEVDLAPVVPTHIQVAPLGEWKTHPKGPFKIGEKDVAEAVENFDSVMTDAVIDLEHQSLLEGHDAPATGWIKKLYDKGQGGLWADVDWTERGLSYLATKEKRYISPVFFFNYKDPETGKNVGAKLDSAALTNRPYIENQSAIVNKKQSEDLEMKELLQKLGTLLGLTKEGEKKEITEDAVVTALSKIKDEGGKVKEKLGAVLKALELGEDAEEKEITEKVAAMSKPKKPEDKFKKSKDDDELKVALTRIDSLEKDLHERDRKEFIRAGVQNGKIVEATRPDWEKLFDNDARLAQSHLKNAPQIVPLDKVKDNLVDLKKQTTNEAQQEVNEAIGISDEDMKKFGPKQK